MYAKLPKSIEGFSPLLVQVVPRVNFSETFWGWGQPPPFKLSSSTFWGVLFQQLNTSELAFQTEIVLT